ncbi:MAG TPA: PIN domain-containing protein [Candidatus Angelobacter sp.]
MSDRAFVDTNVLIYAYDIDADAKHRIAKNLLRELWSERNGILSLQVLQEFYVNVTRKISRPISKESARLVVTNYTVWCTDTTRAEIATAFQIEDQVKISFWDALIVASALKSGAARILSEDLNAGQGIAGIRIENPFVALVS